MKKIGRIFMIVIAWLFYAFLSFALVLIIAGAFRCVNNLLYGLIPEPIEIFGMFMLMLIGATVMTTIMLDDMDDKDE